VGPKNDVILFGFPPDASVSRVAEDGGLLNRTGSHQAPTKQAETPNFLK
jgi:hypothetical protein